jgi:aminomethyltransferase
MEKKTPLYDCHIENKGKMVPFAGYLLPVQYELGVKQEHMVVRKVAGLFDVSHMGEVTLQGQDALKNIQNLVTNDCSKMQEGSVKYSPMCNESGGVVDDLLIYKKAEDSYLLVINAANREKDVEWIKNHVFGEVEFRDISDDLAQIALQGPRVMDILSKLVVEDKLPVKYYSFIENVDIAGVTCLVSRTGYTGEIGYEIYCKPEDASKLWTSLMAAGKEEGLVPCGLGARDTLRLEAAMPLYGHEMDEDISPLETGLGFAVKLDKEDFIGKTGIIARGIGKMRVGLDITGRGIAREHCKVYVNDKFIGETTSGTFCPFLDRPVAMALLDVDFTGIGTEVEVEVRGKRIAAVVTELPFYQSKR